MAKHVTQTIKNTIVLTEPTGMIFIVQATLILALRELNGLESTAKLLKKNVYREAIGQVLFV